jgi:hypothetical protein
VTLALTECRECGKQVSTDAKACPHCGTPDPARKKGMSKITKTFLWILAIGIFGNVITPLLGKKDPVSVGASVATPAAPATEIANDELCYKRGASIATVFLANFKTATDVGMSASAMMTNGCQQAVGREGASCIRQCELGFKAEAKQTVREITR